MTVHRPATTDRSHIVTDDVATTHHRGPFEWSDFPEFRSSPGAALTWVRPSWPGFVFYSRSQNTSQRSKTWKPCPHIMSAARRVRRELAADDKSRRSGAVCRARRVDQWLFYALAPCGRGTLKIGKSNPPSRPVMNPIRLYIIFVTNARAVPSTRFSARQLLLYNTVYANNTCATVIDVIRRGVLTSVIRVLSNIHQTSRIRQKRGWFRNETVITPLIDASSLKIIPDTRLKSMVGLHPSFPSRVYESLI